MRDLRNASGYLSAGRRIYRRSDTVNLRQLHTYVGLFIAPSVIFFALSGSLQLFNLHESHGAYHPPPILERLSRVHKDQVFALDEHDDDAADSPPSAAKAPAGEAADHHHDDEPKLPTYLLKWFFLSVALGLVSSTCLGLWLGLTQARHQRVGWILLIAGAAIPIALLLI
jgi:hypothetical protein